MSIRPAVKQKLFIHFFYFYLFYINLCLLLLRLQIYRAGKTTKIVQNLT